MLFLENRVMINLRRKIFLSQQLEFVVIGKVKEGNKSATSKIDTFKDLATPKLF